MSEEQKPVEPRAAYTPPSQLSPAELMKAFQEEGIVGTPEVAKPAEAAPEQVKAAEPEPVKPPEPPKEEVTRLVQIAREKAAKRQEMEQAKPQLEALKVFTPQELMRLAQARASNNPKEALRAMGFSHEAYNNSVIAEDKAEAPAEKAPTGNPDVDSLRQEIQALKQERENEKMQTTRSQVLGQMKNILADSPKFSTINALGDFEGVEKVLIDFHAMHGSLPGDTLEESVQIAAEQYEAQLKKEAEKWRKVLTPPASSVPVVSGAPAKPPAGTASPRTLTNANTTAPAAPRSVAKSREEVIAAITEGRDQDLPT